MQQHSDSHHALPDQTSNHPKPCKSTGIPCCLAMTSCAQTLAVGSRASSTAFAIERHAVPAFHLARPLSRIAAPEPPPPKA